MQNDTENNVTIMNHFTNIIMEVAILTYITFFHLQKVWQMLMGVIKYILLSLTE